MNYTHLLVVAAWIIVTSILNVALRVKTPEQWVALADQKPRIHALIRMLQALGCDPAKLITAVVDFAKGQAQAAQADTTEKKK